MQNIKLAIFLIIGTLLSCQPTTKPASFTTGTYGYDVSFLQSHLPNLIQLRLDSAAIAIAPEYQGRVMTSTANGMGGLSFGWINHELIESGEVQEHMNAYGGEERLWLGPEGGQFSIYFQQDASFRFANWYVPKEIDTEAFDLVSVNEEEAVFQKQMELVNYSGTTFSLQVDRTVRILDASDMASTLSMSLPDNIDYVGYHTINTLTNTGDSAWTAERGALSIWILCMFIPSDQTVAAFPFVPGAEDILGQVVTSNYFGEVSPDRISVQDSVVFFKCDGKSRGKLGFSAQRAKAFSGSYDKESGVLTIAHYSLDPTATEYVNSLWEIQEAPFQGDAVNAYNDGPLEDGSQMGPFYELESSSPAAFLSPGEKLTHMHLNMHFQGSEEALDRISQQVLGVSLKEFEEAF